MPNTRSGGILSPNNRKIRPPHLQDSIRRINNRLSGYDYSGAGAYFVTICTKKFEALFGTIVPAVGADTIRPHLSCIGEVVDNSIIMIPQIHQNVVIDCYVIMPNHVHLILLFTADKGGRMISAPTTNVGGQMISTPTTLSKIIGYFKRHVSLTAGFPVWQKSFHDHIIRDDEDYLRIVEYIENNPAKWADDRYYKRP